MNRHAAPGGHPAAEYPESPRATPGLSVVHARIVVFTQTGNTLAIGDAMAEALEAEGFRATIYPANLFHPHEIDIQTGDVLIVGSPVFFSRAPTAFRRYLRELPSLRGVRAITYVTAGGASGRALGDLRDGLQHRGAEVIGGAVYGGEVRYPLPVLTSRAIGRPDREDLQRAADLAIAGTIHTAAGTRGSLPSGLPSWAPLSQQEALESPRGFYSRVGRLLTDGVIRSVLGEPVIDRDACTTCGWCVQHCPMDAITFPEPAEDTPLALDGSRREPPEITGECIRCYRCLACPVDAYHVEQGWTARLIRLPYHPGLVERYGDWSARSRRARAASGYLSP